MADKDDLVDAPGEQAIDLGLDGRCRPGQIGGDGDVAGDGDPAQARGRRADQAEARPRGRIVDDHGAPEGAAADDRRLDKPVVIDEVREAGLAGEVEVGAEEGLVPEAPDEAFEDIGRRVELVIADDVRIVGDGVLGDGIEEGGSLALAAEIRGGGEVGIARVHRQDRVPGGPGLVDLPGDDRLEGGDAGDGDLDRDAADPDGVRERKQCGLAVVVVEKRQGDLAATLGGDRRGSPARGGQQQRDGRREGESDSRSGSYVRQGHTSRGWRAGRARTGREPTRGHGRAPAPKRRAGADPGTLPRWKRGFESPRRRRSENRCRERARPGG